MPVGTKQEQDRKVRRGWQGAARIWEETEQQAKRLRSSEGGGQHRKLPKRKVVLLVAYSGKGYHGMQVRAPAGWAGVLGAGTSERQLPSEPSWEVAERGVSFFTSFIAWVPSGKI